MAKYFFAVSAERCLTIIFVGYVPGKILVFVICENKTYNFWPISQG
jgi:hypothetical protein